MAERLKGSLTEKVGEIKRMQSNWMRERSQNIDGRESMGETREGGGERKGRDKSARKSAQTNDKSGSETMSWSMGNSKKKPLSTQNSTKPSTKQQTLRTRSASPARSATNSAKKSPSASSSSAASKRNGSSSRPSSARSTASEGSRPPSGRNYPSSSQPDKSARTDHKRRVGDNDSISLGTRERTDVRSTRGDLGDRFHSEPNLNNFEGSDRGGETSSRRLQGDMGDYDSTRGVQSTHSLGHSKQTVDDQCMVRDSQTSSQVDGSALERRPRPKPSLDPDAFDRLADQIATRVKAEMKDERQELIRQSGYPQNVLDEPNDQPEGYIEGHHCCKCKQLMIPPDHSATLLVPCGHTLCEACAEDRIKCPTCRTRVTSTSLNSTLQEIISSSRPNSGACPLASHSQPLTNHRTPSDVNQNHVSTHSTNHYPDSHRTQQYTPSRYADEGQVHSRPEGGTEHLTRGFNNNDNNARTRESKDAGSEKVDVARSRRKMSPEEEARKLEDEYQSLGIRCEALESEEADVVERVEKQNQEIAKHKQQMGNISQKQQHLRDEIKSLEKRLAGLEGHRQEYKRQVEDAEDRKREELDQLAMVRTMLRDKQRDRERVKMSARKLNVSLD
ncbi:uncharacterized protein LOC105437690 isoform X1 [Strongylocentrotus purpuratus]|uniref:RING-type domain-containing protein n=1 Tax=Strongylocentrotus purpuratus TaxID=7668 RepID=A0A7M7P5B5_STRPU|nr:uncharacterized protein LOC105437690 isoform X1 [Strongylocentrotus purpuratus]